MPDNVSRRFKNLAIKAGFPEMNSHDLQHTFATLALAAGIHPKIVQTILGHSTIAITLDIYSHVLPGLYNEAADIIESMVNDIKNEVPKRCPSEQESAPD